MSRLGDRLAAIGRRGHISETRIYELSVSAPTAPGVPAEQAHLDVCARCRGLVEGHRRAEAVLSGAWTDRPFTNVVSTSAATDSMARLRVVRRAGHVSGVRWVLPVGAAAVLIAVLVGAGLLGLRGGGQPAAGSGSPSATPVTPPGTGVVARLPVGPFGSFAWSPDGAHLLVLDDSGGHVYDRFGKLVSEFGQAEGWLDATHLISLDGHVSSVDEPYSSSSTLGGGVVAGGHGSAAILVAVPACTGDPLIDWYENGKYVKAGEKVTPFGWSPDGKLVLLGHMDCSSEDAAMHGWKGPVQIVDFATRRVLATAPAVRGAMAFNPSGTRLAAQSDQNLEIVDIATGRVSTLPNVRLLGWSDDNYVYCLTAAGSVARVGATPEFPPFNGIVAEWAITSSIGLTLDFDASGTPIQIVGLGGKVALDLSPADLARVRDVGDATSTLLRSPWSPDGRMLALKSADGTSLALISVDPSQVGAVGSALPTPVGSPQVLAELDRTALPGPVSQLVADAKRDAFWFLGGVAGGPVELYRYDVSTAALTSHPITGTTFDAARDRIAIGSDGRLWIGAGYALVAYEPDANRQTELSPPVSGPDVQSDPKAGKPDPWIAGIAFDSAGNALVARNWVRSLLRVDGSLTVLPGQVDVSDGFPMTGGIVVAGGRAFVVADPESGFGFGVDATGTGKLSNVKFQASRLVAVGDEVLVAGTPPAWIDASGGGAAMIEPVMAAADLVAAGPNEIAALYDNATGDAQWRDSKGRVSGRATFPAGTAPHIATIALDGQGRLWAVESTGGSYALVRVGVGR